jgi:hypothetical protein
MESSLIDNLQTRFIIIILLRLRYANWTFSSGCIGNILYAVPLYAPEDSSIPSFLIGRLSNLMGNLIMKFTFLHRAL